MPGKGSNLNLVITRLLINYTSIKLIIQQLYKLKKMKLHLNNDESFPQRENLHPDEKENLSERTKVVYDNEKREERSKKRRRIKRVHIISEKV